MLITPQSYANQQNVDNLNGTLLIYITNEEEAQIFSFDPDSEWQFDRMCGKIWPTFDCLPGFHSYFVLRMHVHCPSMQQITTFSCLSVSYDKFSFVRRI